MHFADRIPGVALASLILILTLHGTALGDHGHGPAKPVDSVLRVAVGEMAPDFTLPDLAGNPVRLRDFRGRKNVVLSFVPAAWTPVCSDQWPGYNLITDLLDQHDTVLLGITVDNTPSQHAWVQAMGGLKFPVLSDFWPHGAVADEYGILRSSGEAERALFVIDKQGVLRFIDVHDINTRPDLVLLVREVEKLD
ncbi:redoxin domain-containing protein [Pseudodesulfovibrio pelocollis]|uniref:redoxin domain-containing protein n=1 Tax=Pseudodesulfovibrio pelocollis TaxID=3051432 RepID=UPI00255B3CB2|nr:redoxin domain-containing protein [Pseudodesulfovibrio sp. SB368]